MLSEEYFRNALGPELSAVSELGLIVDAQVQPLKPIQLLFPGLRELDLSHSLDLQITDIPQLDRLESLILDSCGLTSLDGLYNFGSLLNLIVPNN